MVDKDRSGFQQVLVTSVIVIISTSLVIYTITTEVPTEVLTFVGTYDTE
jgi:hypothetical protein